MTISRNSQGVRLPSISTITDSLDFTPKADTLSQNQGLNYQTNSFANRPSISSHSQSAGSRSGQTAQTKSNPCTLPPISSLLSSSDTPTKPVSTKGASVVSFPPYPQSRHQTPPQHSPSFPTLHSSSPVLSSSSPIIYASSPYPSNVSLGSNNGSLNAVSSASSNKKIKLRCECCSCESTPEWRRGPNGARTLCNACGLYFAKISKRKGIAYAAEEMKRKKELKEAKRISRTSNGSSYSVISQTFSHPHHPGVPSHPEFYPHPSVAAPPPHPAQHIQNRPVEQYYPSYQVHHHPGLVPVPAGMAPQPTQFSPQSYPPHYPNQSANHGPRYYQ